MVFIVVSFTIQVASGIDKKPSEDINRACIVRFLQIRGKLEQTIQSSTAPANLCRILLPLVYANHSERLCLKLWETKSVSAECVFELLKKSEFIDLELTYEIYIRAKHISKNIKKRRILEITNKQREILVKSAKTCRSDETYGGIFDDILGIGSSLIVKQEDFCLLNYVLENKFIFVSNVSKNPFSIDPTLVDCVFIVTRSREENERKLKEAFRLRKYSEEAILCLMQTYNDEKIFGWNLAKDFLLKLNMADSVRRAEDWRISKILSDFNMKSSNCLYSFNWTLF